MNEDGKKLNELFERYYPSVIKYCLVKLNGDEQAAADCANEVYLRAREAGSRLLEHPDPLGWLYRTASNVAHERLREEKRQLRLIERLLARDPLFRAHAPFYSREQRIISELWSDDAEALGFELTDEELNNIKSEILDSLPEGDRELLRLAIEQKLSPSEIAIIQHRSRDAVRVKLSRLYDKLTVMVHDRISQEISSPADLEEEPK